jgi:DNA-binding winged helix-turn-helix (wHTH) protein
MLITMQPPLGGRAYLFGPFRLSATERALQLGDRQVRLGSRALDILITLVERAGELVSKRDLIDQVWPDTTVVEANLTVHVAALRRALGDGQGGNRYVVNIPGRGYRFVAPVAIAEKNVPPSAQSPPAIRRHNLPAQLTRLFGRSEDICQLAKRLLRQRLLTLVGPGGIGKTALAVNVVEGLLPAYEHGIWLIDLAPIADPLLVPIATASALGMNIRSDDPLPALIAALKDKKMLLVLDNCEHVVEAAAALALAILRGSRDVGILATSREPLRVESEHVYRLKPLQNPPHLMRLNAVEALRFPAVQLFTERAAENAGDFELRDVDAANACDIPWRSNSPLRGSIRLAFADWPKGSMIGCSCLGATAAGHCRANKLSARHSTGAINFSARRSSWCSGDLRCSPADSRWTPLSPSRPVSKAI